MPEFIKFITMYNVCKYKLDTMKFLAWKILTRLLSTFFSGIIKMGITEMGKTTASHQLEKNSFCANSKGSSIRTFHLQTFFWIDPNMSQCVTFFRSYVCKPPFLGKFAYLNSNRYVFAKQITYFVKF